MRMAHVGGREVEGEQCVRCSVFRCRDLEEEHREELDIDGRVML